MSIPFIEIEVHGDGYERGFSHGKQVKEYIMPYFGRALSQLKNISGKEQMLNEVQAYMEKYFPELLDEMQGIAAGVNVPFDDIFLLNNMKLMGMFRSGCSNLGLSSSAVGPVLIGTVDGNNIVTGPMFIQRFYPQHGYRVLGTVFPGCVWVEKAVNERGVAIGNSSVTTKDFRTDGLPKHALFREMLFASGTTGQAVEFLTRYNQNASSSVIIIVDAQGSLARMEKTPTITVTSKITEGFAVAANAFLDAQTSAIAVVYPEKIRERVGRYKILNKFGENLYPNGTLDEFRACLRYHGKPASICRHGVKDFGMTRESYIITCASPGMFVGERGFACKTSLDAFFAV